MDANAGTFVLKPETGKNYLLTVTDLAGNKKTMDMPAAKDEGLLLEVRSQTGAIIYTPKFNVLPKSSFFKIIGQINNKLVVSSTVTSIQSGENYKIPTPSLVNGILQLMILDDQNNILAERLTFVDAKKLNLGKINLSKTELKAEPKGMNVISLTTKSPFANFTALVQDGSIENTENEKSLLSTMWLTGDISSKMHAPAQYFTPTANAAALDALLITEKWSRFNWKQIIAGNFPKIINKPYSYIAYTGKTTMDGSAAKNKVLNLVYTAKDSGTNFFQTKQIVKACFYLII